jgi:hypothetical protein
MAVLIDVNSKKARGSLNSFNIVVVHPFFLIVAGLPRNRK